MKRLLKYIYISLVNDNIINFNDIHYKSEEVISNEIRPI